LEFLDNLRGNLDLAGRCAMITSPVNRRYFTGFNSSDGFLLVFENEAFFLTDSRYTEAAEREAHGVTVVLLEKTTEQINALFESHSVKEVFIEADRATVADLRKYEKQFSGVKVNSSDTLAKTIRRLRMIKTTEEVANIKAAQKIAHEAFTKLLAEPFTRDTTEKTLAAKLEYLMKTGGAEDISFETITLIGENSSMPHGVPGKRTAHPGDALLMDFGATFAGYHSDMTRTVFLGEVSDENRAIWEIVCEAKRLAIEAIKPGIPCLEIDKIARDFITSKGFGEKFGHGLGHSVGLEIHEYPVFGKTCKELLLPGMIMTVEPGIYLPGNLGVRLEDMVVITENGCENLTETPNKLIQNAKFL
jgi:Xaa-Pro aminopeptidase